jgi:CubicO group peptidase (beta-lactamase class C family)
MSACFERPRRWLAAGPPPGAPCGTPLTSRPYEALLVQQRLRPLGMGDTKISLTTGDLERFAAHDWPEALRVERPRPISGEVCVFAGLASAVPYLARSMSMPLVHLQNRV